MAITKISKPNHSELFGLAVDVFFDFIRKTSGEVVVAVCGGRSVKGFLEAGLSKASELSLADWARLQFFMVDERLVPLMDKDSNFNLVNGLLVEGVVKAGLIKMDQVHPFIFEPESSDHGLGKYEAELDAHGGRFHVVILGVGEDGHVAALFPGRKEFFTKQPGRRFVSFTDSPKPPAGRMSGSIELITSADCALTFLIGEEKRSALNNYLNNELQVIDCPVKMIQEIKQAYLFTDLI